MKKILLALVICISLVANTGCSLFILGSALLSSGKSENITDPAKYGSFNSSVKIPDYYPESISAYTVSRYYYAMNSAPTLAYEIYLDITMPEADFDALIAKVTSDTRQKTTKDAFHSTDYNEIIFSDEYEFEYKYNEVKSANIEKVIYHKTKPRVVFVLFVVEEGGSYDLESIEYFNRLRIDPFDYHSRKTNEV